MKHLKLVPPTAEPTYTAEGLLLYKLIESMAERIADLEIDMLHVMADIADKEEEV